MRLLILIVLRMFSAFSCLLALMAAGQLAFGAYGVFTTLKEFPDLIPINLGGLYGEFIIAPAILTAFFAPLSFILWRLSSRFRSKSPANPPLNIDA